MLVGQSMIFPKCSISALAPGFAFNSNPVKLPAVVALGMLVEICFQRGEHVCLLAGRERSLGGGKGEGSARLHPNEDQQLVLAGNTIDLATEMYSLFVRTPYPLASR